MLTEKQLDDLEWAKKFLNNYEKKHKKLSSNFAGVIHCAFEVPQPPIPPFQMLLRVISK